MSTTEINPQVNSGKLIPISGYYKYLEHVIPENNEKCFIPSQTNMMLFKKDDKAPRLGSCPHDVVWKLIASV